MKKEMIIGLVILVVFITLGAYFIVTNKIQENQCDSLNSIDSSENTKAVIECYLNKEKINFESGIKNVPATEILKGECNITEIKERYLDNKYNQVVNKPCTNCRLEGAMIWFECSEYTSQGPFGCFFDINNDFTFSEIRCPLGV